MRIIRYIFFIIFLIASLATAGIAYLLVQATQPLRLNLPYVGHVEIGYIVAGCAVIIFLISLMIMPFGKIAKRPGAVKKLPPDPGQVQRAADRQAAAQREASKASSSAQPQKQFDESPPLPSVPEDKSETHESQQKWERVMQQLVAVEQKGITIDVLQQLLDDFYPELAGLTGRIDHSHASTIETLGKQILEIARFKVKMRDPHLSDNQFSTFQDKAFDAERSGIVQIYKPDPNAALNNVQKEAVGMVFDKRDWESSQRKIRGERTDWHTMSFANAKELIS